MPKIQEIINKKGHKTRLVIIPKAIADMEGWKKGDKLEFKRCDGRICLENPGKV